MVNKIFKNISSTLKIIYIIIAIIFVLLVVYFLMSMMGITGMATSGVCVDSDNTIFPLVGDINDDPSYFEEGFLIYDGRQLNDTCYPQTHKIYPGYLVERYCDKWGKMRYRRLKCELGCEIDQITKQGSCVGETKANKNLELESVFGGLYHAADIDKDWKISNSELLRVIQFFNSGGYHCQSGTEDGFASGVGDGSCYFHSADSDGNWEISLSELLRVIQFFNSGAYHVDPTEMSEDGYLSGEFQGYPDCNTNSLTYSQERLWNDFEEGLISEENIGLIVGQYSWIDTTNLNKCDKVFLAKNAKAWEFILRI